MALLQATLKTRLLRLMNSESPAFVGYPSTLEQTAENWADAYDIYAQNAVDISDDALTTASKAGFKNALIANLPEGTGTAALAATAFQNALIGFWTGAIFNIGSLPPNGIGGNGIFGVEISSVVTEIVPNVLYDLLLAEFSKTTFETDMNIKADTLANIFHNATITSILVLISGTDTTLPGLGGPLPITNISSIH